MKVMLDTNILVSMIFFPTEQTRYLIRVLSERHRIVLCDYVKQELRLVVERKFPEKIKFIDQFFQELPYDLLQTDQSISGHNIPMIRDKKDAPILATAIIRNVDVLLTGDKDFLVLKLEHPEIMTMTEFLEKYSL